MFGNKKNSKIEKNKYSEIQTIVIPEVFYGGQDPYIYHDHEEKLTATTKSNSIVDSNKNKKKLKSSKSNVNKSAIKKIWIFGSIFFVIAVAAISWYYIDGYNKARLQLLSQNNVVTPEVIVKNTTTNVDNQVVTGTPNVVVSSTIDVPTTTPSLDNVFLELPAIITLDTSDIDADSLTDLEEGIFGTDSGTWDTDKDNYYDGQEVYNLYNPKGQAPVKIVDSGLVKEYKNSTVGYRIYYPSGWQRGSVDTRETQVLFSASTGDYIEVRFFKKDVGQQFVSWFSRNAEGQNYNDLSPFVNRFGEKAMVRKDSLVSYFEDENFIYTIIYHPKDRIAIMYRHVMQMMYQSFRMSKTTNVLPDQNIYPETSSSTATSSVINIILPTLDTQKSSSTSSNN
ncbi:MAG: hypothetical protein ACD_18C00141G0004 [uncultured bacterium]|nr:MAG: hypothetical protein ACD_18C00141G0004 [uncultured bacterium]OGH83977.1 MAG: hypothetical protein A2488_03130 [Candidatus Magasanikbacteria bacterium RIFOXYC12_FULL_32_21b]OGH88873.1 MAG: hypothetical protein A2507_03210 [Candidatus Magasanikbacteria bacterium RIFOXYD12_FULL_33_17]HAO52537.1 hypothetical protein [Candidatus Magasanikbacteria bacterium]